MQIKLQSVNPNNSAFFSFETCDCTGQVFEWPFLNVFGVCFSVQTFSVDEINRWFWSRASSSLLKMLWFICCCCSLDLILIFMVSKVFSQTLGITSILIYLLICLVPNKMFPSCLMHPPFLNSCFLHSNFLTLKIVWLRLVVLV